MAAWTVDLEVTADGRIDWPEGRLVLPDSGSLSLSGHPSFAIMEVRGDYERPSAREKILRVWRIRVLKSALVRLREALRSAKRDPDHFDRLRRQTSELLASDQSADAQSLRLELACFSSDVLAAEREFRGLLLRPDARAVGLKTGWNFLASSMCGADLSSADRLALASSVTIGLWNGPALPTPSADAIRPWLDYLFDLLATDEERKMLHRWQTQDLETLADRVGRIEDRDETRMDRAMERTHDRYFRRGGDPTQDYGPPDEPDAKVRRESETLPVVWASAVVSLHRYGPSSMRTHHVSRRCNAGALGASRTAVTILASIAPEVATKFRRTRALAKQPLRVSALLELADGSLSALTAAEGMFGDWQVTPTTESSFREENPSARFFSHLKSEPKAPPAKKPKAAQPVRPPSARPARDAAPGDVVPKIGSQVVHPRFGQGEVIGETPGPAGPKLRVQFEVGTKVILYKFVKPAAD